MPLYMVERTFAEQLEVTGELVKEITAIYDEEGIRWLSTFLTADKKRSYCIYEAPSAEACRKHAEAAGLPVDEVIAIGAEIGPEQFR